MPLAHDHVIYLVDDPAQLDGVCARFREAGFLITERDDAGQETAKTQQRLICFADGSYIEFLALRDPELRKQHRYAYLLGAGGGWVDYALVTDRLERERDACESAGLPIQGPQTHSRKLSDGRPWGVSLFLAGIGAGHPALPLVLQDTEGRELRIPSDRTDHPNRATGILGATLVVRDLEKAREALSVLLGSGESLDDEVGPGGLRFPVLGAWVEIVEAGDPQSLAAKRLARWGEGLVSVTLAQPPGSAPREILCDGPRSSIRFVPRAPSAKRTGASKN